MPLCCAHTIRLQPVHTLLASSRRNCSSERCPEKVLPSSSLASQLRVLAITVTACAAAAAAASARSRCAPPRPWRQQQAAVSPLSGGRACGRTSAGCRPPVPRGRSEHTSSSPSGFCSHAPPVRAQPDLTGCLHCGQPDQRAGKPSSTNATARETVLQNSRSMSFQSCPASSMLAILPGGVPAVRAWEGGNCIHKVAGAWSTWRCPCRRRRGCWASPRAARSRSCPGESARARWRPAAGATTPPCGPGTRWGAPTCARVHCMLRRLTVLWGSLFWRCGLAYAKKLVLRHCEALLQASSSLASICLSWGTFLALSRHACPLVRLMFMYQHPPAYAALL